MTLREFLRGYRAAKGLSGRKLSELIGVDKYRLQKWESLGVSPKMEDATKIKEYFKLKDIAAVSEEVLNKRTKSDPGEWAAHVDNMHYQKDELLAEKDKRIIELNRTINILEEALAVYKTAGKRENDR